jgi:hypothetical protein
MRNAILDALEAKYEAQAQEALVNIEVYLSNPAGIGEHPEIIEAIDSQVTKLAEAREKVEILQVFY